MEIIDTSVATVRPKQPFVDWINKVYPDSVVTLETYDDECGPHTYLIPDFEDLKSAKHWLKKYYHILFQVELTDWCRDENVWPKEMTYKLFTQ